MHNKMLHTGIPGPTNTATLQCKVLDARFVSNKGVPHLTPFWGGSLDERRKGDRKSDEACAEHFN